MHALKGSKRFKWLSQEAPSSEKPPALSQSAESADTELRVVALEPQVLRTFKISYLKKEVQKEEAKPEEPKEQPKEQPKEEKPAEKQQPKKGKKETP